MFKVGDTVIRTHEPFQGVDLTPDRIYTVTQVENSFIKLVDDWNVEEKYLSCKFELAPELVKEESFDVINKAKHYNKGIKIEPIEYIVANNMGFCAGNVVKYVTRYKLKGSPKKDLEKAKYYIDKLIAELDKEEEELHEKA